MKALAEKLSAKNDLTRSPGWMKPPSIMAKQHLTSFPGGNPFIQPKLKIGQPNDKYEQEADQVADRVMRMPEPKGSSVNGHWSLGKGGSGSPLIQRQSEECPECNEKEEEAVQTKPISEQITPLVQRQVESEEEEEEETAQAKSLSNKSPPVTPGLQNQIQSLKGSGQPLTPSTRSFFESRFGHDFSQVRIHSGIKAAKSVNARAFTFGKDIIFGAGQYSTETTEGKRLLAHELTHVVQQNRRFDHTAPDVVRRKDFWEEWKTPREYLDPKKIPKTFNYELIKNELWAHTSSKSDIDQIVELISMLNLYYGKPTDKSDVKKKLEKSWEAAVKGGARGSINITLLLPKSLQTFLGELKSYYKAYNDYVATNKVMPGKDRMDIIIYYEKKIKLAKSKEEKEDLRKEKLEKIEAWSKGAPKSPKEYEAACHQFLMMAISGTTAGSKPGRYVDTEYEKSLDLDLEKIRTAYQQAIKGKGPFRIVRKRHVKIGDIAVFQLKSGFITHSAFVIRVSGGQIEVLEKTDPQFPMATRTVQEIRKSYTKERPSVHFLTPALEGMPGESPRDLGRNPPTGKYTNAKGKAPENTHVLFKVNTNVTLPHEDKKLFSFIVTHKKPVDFNVHGYASKEGKSKYNLNLSAHRAVAVKKAMIKHLPGGSKAEAFARGETSAFGSLKENRRAGIEVKGKIKPKGKGETTESETPGTSRQTGFTPPYSTFSDLSKLRLSPRFLALPPSFLMQGKPYLTSPTLDYFKLGEPYRNRGLKPDAKDWESIEKLWMKNYRIFNFDLRLSPKIAEFLSNLSTSFYVDQQLYLQRPTTFEEFEQKWLEQPKMLKIDIFEAIRLFK